MGGAGVQRSAKFAKYLPKSGWNVSVLTAANPSVPLFDESLCASVPKETIVERVRTWEPSYSIKSKVAAGKNGKGQGALGRRLKSLLRSAASAVLQPDPQILWAPNAVRHGRDLLKRLSHQVVLATGPPFSSFIVAARLSRHSNLPLVLDYRDEWGISNTHWENRSGQGLGNRLQQRMQNGVLRQAAAVLATTEASANHLRSLVDQAGSSAVVSHIYNGYDPDDFGFRGDAQPRAKYRITYVGTLWGLTSIEPLVDAILRLEEVDKPAAAQLELVVAGRRTERQDAILSRLESSRCQLVRQGYLAHDDAVKLLDESDRLCILLTDAVDAGRVVPAKLFEYLAAQKPLLTISPRGEVWDIVAKHPDAGVHLPSDIDGIVQTLRESIRNRNSASNRNWTFEASGYSCASQAAQLANLLDQVSATSSRETGVSA